MKLSKWEVENTDNIYIPTESFGWCIGRRGCKTQGEVWLADIYVSDAGIRQVEIMRMN